MSNTNNAKLPTHRAYAVLENNGRRFWREIGAAWSHGDGDGLSLKLDYLPLNGAEIVIRKPLADRAQPDGGNGTEGREPARAAGKANGRDSSPHPH